MRERTRRSRLLTAFLLGLCFAPLATGKEPAIPLTAQGEKLLATYKGMLDSLRGEIRAAAGPFRSGPILAGGGLPCGEESAAAGARIPFRSTLAGLRRELVEQGGEG